MPPSSPCSSADDSTRKDEEVGALSGLVGAAIVASQADNDEA